MTKSILGRLVLALAVCLPGAAMAECDLHPRAEIPIVMHGARKLRPVATAMINGVPAELIFDTGASSTVLFRASAAKFSLRASDPPKGFEPRSYGQIVKAEFATADVFSFADQATRGTRLTVLDSDFGPGIDGLLGEAEMGSFDIEFDLARGIVRLFSPTGCSAPDLAYWAKGKPVSVIALEPRERSSRPFGLVEINGVSLRAMFDTGTPTTSLTAEAAARAGVRPGDPGVVSSGPSKGVGPVPLKTWIASFRTLKIGDEVMRDVTLGFTEKPNASADLLIGADFFLTHRVLISRSGNLLVATSNARGGLAAQPDGQRR